MPTTINGNKLRKCNVTVGGTTYKCKRINVNGVKVWTGEEKFSQEISCSYFKRGGYWGPDTDGDGNPDSFIHTEDGWGETIGTIDIPAGDTFRIDSLIPQWSTSTTTQVELIVNGTTVLNQTIHSGQVDGHSLTYGPYPSASDYYTSTQATGTIQFIIRGKCSAAQWDHSPTGYLTINYTVGV